MSYKSSEGGAESDGFSDSEISGASVDCAASSGNGEVPEIMSGVGSLFSDGVNSAGMSSEISGAGVLCSEVSVVGETGAAPEEGVPPEKPENREDNMSGDKPPSMENKSGDALPVLFPPSNPPKPPSPEKSPAMLPKAEDGSAPEPPIPEKSPGRMSL